MADFSTLNGYSVKDAAARASIGDLSQLTTMAATSLVDAINEVGGNADTNASSIGTLSSLSTTHKGNLVEAINEVNAAAGGSDWASVAGLAGRNLVTVLGVSSVSAAAQALKTKSDNKDYSGLRLGDYLEITATYGEYGSITAKYEIASMGHYHWLYAGTAGGTYDMGNITFVASKVLFKRQIGTSASQLAYFSSPMNTFLTATVATALEAALGTTLKRPVLYQSYNDGTASDPDWQEDSYDHDFDTDEIADIAPKVYLPSIRELIGEKGRGFEYIENSRQFPLFVNVPGKIPPRKTDANIEWTRTPSVGPGSFCGVYTDGGAHSSGANYSAGGVRPAFNL